MTQCISAAEKQLKVSLSSSRWSQWKGPGTQARMAHIPDPTCLARCVPHQADQTMYSSQAHPKTAPWNVLRCGPTPLCYVPPLIMNSFLNLMSWCLGSSLVLQSMVGSASHSPIHTVIHSNNYLIVSPMSTLRTCHQMKQTKLIQSGTLPLEGRHK